MRHLVFVGEVVYKLGADKAIHGFKEGKPLGFRCTGGCISCVARECNGRKLGNLCSSSPRITDSSRGLRCTKEASSSEGNSEASGQPKRDDE